MVHDLEEVVVAYDAGEHALVVAWIEWIVLPSVIPEIHDYQLVTSYHHTQLETGGDNLTYQRE